ncbi:hypothetical protein BDV95DRAFT_390152 [Massariosphaeria phaeospora]|uniref:Uncharacterized protein n=1 Tax=Massariosphaeria phaeospora TaxID=100035 RepID=A0A7C8MGA6_9PLEO|nr:hypothetical protein BDV95DRAFT_390152 [Massariosphaeria phaeospora]
MGLPVWRAPSPEPGRDAPKDLTAPARSPIRRAAPRARVARRGSPPSPRLSSRLIEHEFLARALPAPPSRLAHVEPAVQPSNLRTQLPPPPVPESRNYRFSDAPLHPGLPDSDAMQRQLRSLEEYHTAHLRDSPDASVPSSFALAYSSRHLPAFTPNFAPAAASRESRREHAANHAERSPVHGRSPYHRAAGRSRLAWLEAGRRDNRRTVDDGDEDGSDNNAVGFPPLRRMGRRTIADGPLPSSSLRESWSPATTLDGLGDRDRSLSPIDDHWDTMLSTVAPDPLAPTADSSFTSAAASASFSNSHPSSRAGSSNSNSASSSRTHITVPSRRGSPPTDGFFRACDTSEDDSASDTEEEELELTPELAWAPSPRRHRYHAAEPPARNPERYSRRVHDRSGEASAYVRRAFLHHRPSPPVDNTRSTRSRLINRPDGPADEPTTGDNEVPALDQELRDARALLERLTRRPDVTDEFWASVGLNRPMADRVERFQQLERLS